MKIIMCQPSNVRFEWELQVSINNLLEFKEISKVVLLFLHEDPFVSERIKKRFGDFVEIHTYFDSRENKDYIPSIKPFLWYNFLEENPEQQNEDFFYIDSDVIFREMIDFSNFQNDNIWYGSDCNGYLNADYIRNTKNGQTVLEEMCKIVGVEEYQFEKINYDCIGAQLIVKKPQMEYWKKVYEDSNKLWDYFRDLDSNIQKWTAEMWSQLMNMSLFGIKPQKDSEFNFTWATDSIEKWFENKIYHNAGAEYSSNDMFFKGKYGQISPFNEDFSQFGDKYASFYYVKALEKAKN